MHVVIDKVKYNVIINKKVKTKNTYIRVNKDLDIVVSTNYFTTNRYIIDLIDSNINRIKNMINTNIKKKENNDGFFYLGKKYNIIYKDIKKIEFDNDNVYFSKDFDIYKWYRMKAMELFSERLLYNYNNYSIKLPKPSLRIRKMTSRWGVCNVRSHVITINLELIKRDIKYLDYVIIHELAHLKHADHSSLFWQLVEDNMKDYKKYKKEMRDF